MAHLKWVLGVSAALFLLPIAAAFLLQPKPDHRPTVLVGNSNTAPQANTEAGEVFVASGSPIEVPNAPIQLLMTALKSHSAARRFRITWSYNAFNYFSDETAIYDRKACRLALFSTDNNGSHSHLVFTGVKESVFPEIIARHLGNYQGNAWGYFDDLDKYGCRRYDLTVWHKAPLN